MGRKDGALFSKSLFGYKRKDVLEYIRNVDTDYADSLAAVNADKELLQNKLNICENKLEETEELLSAEKAANKELIKNLTLDYEKRLSEINKAYNALKDKLSDSETRASSYLKLIDSSSLRAETAEAELAVLSASIDDYKVEISDLKLKVAEKEAEIKRISEFDAIAKKIIDSNNANKRSEQHPIITLFKKRRHHK
jgi:chromosome segregation ATPase